MHTLGFQAGSKSNWTLTHHHEVKFASEYLKLTENIFDMKKQKGTVQLPNPSVSLAVITSLAVPVMKGAWQSLENTGLGPDSQLPNDVIALSLDFSIW